jgi:hypothetical protein
MKPTTEGWWWISMGHEPEAVNFGEGSVCFAGDDDSIDADDPRIVWLGPVAPFAPSPDPAAPDASDEVRLAAGWVQHVNPRGLKPDDDAHGAPGPAGLWRLHASGVWVRWVVA